MRNTRVELSSQLVALGGCFFIAAFVLALLTVTVKAQEKVTAEQLLNKHLESIGTSDARRKNKSHVIFGVCRATFRGRGAGVLTGRAVLASEDTRNLIGVQFNSADYPSEKLGFDGQNFTVGYIKPGIRSVLGNFLIANNDVSKEGLIGGALSSAWPLRDLSRRNARIEYQGIERIDNRPLHKVRYMPRKGSDLVITLYFDVENFRHVRTQYEKVIAARIGTTVDASAGNRETRYKLIENFSDFKTEAGLNLPHTYVLDLFIDTTNGTVAYNYAFSLNQFRFDQELGSEFFNATE
ncbi:MAG: hypothetical protein H0V88_00290 [Pyrinomonadaceae bacterium]|nr:hypothetical protein [Pyrinomonadaceae bacterium]